MGLVKGFSSRPHLHILALYVAAIVGVSLGASASPAVVAVVVGVLANLLAAEVDRSGGAYARWLVRQAGRMLPRAERARWVEEWTDHVLAAGEDGLRPLLVAWEVLIVTAPWTAWEAWWRGPLPGPDSARLLAELYGFLDQYDDAVEAVDRAAIRRAFDFALQRATRTGDSLAIERSTAVARIGVGLRLGTAAISAALLYDAIDSRFALARVRVEFGSDIASIVRGLTKLQGRRFRDPASLRVALGPDHSVALLKLAARLREIRTAHHLPPLEQQDLAEETLEVYAPVTRELGIWAMVWELEDLSFATLWPGKYSAVRNLVGRDREAREGRIAELAEQVEALLAGAGIRAEASGLGTHVYVVYSHVVERGAPQPHELTRLRVVVESEAECYEALRVVQSVFEPLPHPLKDYIQSPRPNGFQALESMVRASDGQPVVIQFQTRAMHLANDFGIAATRIRQCVF